MNDNAQMFLDLGYQPIPLYPGSKRPVGEKWQSRPVADLWADAPQDANIGLRAGDRMAFLDCDDKNAAGTFDRVAAYLAGLGLLSGDYPTVQTASGVGRHVYLSIAGPVSPGSVRILARDVGAGELRYGPGAQVVAPRSTVGAGVYQLIAGDYRQPARLTWRDLAGLLANVSQTASAPAMPTAERPTARPIPRRAGKLLNGNGLEAFSTRSEADASIVLALVNAGFEFEAILGLFMANPASGRFTELREREGLNRAIGYLRLTYDTARQRAETASPGREAAARWLAWGMNSPWPGRTGNTDRAVFLALAGIAARVGRPDNFAASERDVAIEAGMGTMTAFKGMKRLLAAGLVERVQDSTPTLAARYTLPPKTGLEGHPGYTPPHTGCGGVYQVCPSVSHDAFRYIGLGKTCAAIWDALAAGPMSAKALAETTGRNIKTIRRNLAAMACFPPMVERDGNDWRAVEGVDLDAIAACAGTAGRGERQKREHEQQRAIHRAKLKRLAESEKSA